MVGRFISCILVTSALVLADDAEFFERRVRPVLAANCYGCHGPDKQFGNLRLDSRERILRGGGRGPAVIAGHAADSLLVKAIRHDGIAMPVGGKLKPDEIAAIEQWVDKGLPWPADKNVKLAAGDPGFYERILREHWAYQPVKAPTLPDGAEANLVDRFIAAKQRASGISKARRADPRVLARRAAFVLTGLPPSRLDDSSPAGYERFVDELMASPQFGERWARHWMDLVRFAETYGYEWNFEIHGAWRYRDYLIRAFNSDLPYDQFIREHIAGDLLPDPRIHNGKWNESVLATAFYRLGEMGHDNCNQFPEIRTDVVDNQIDTLTKAFQGVTVSCARCHDHKIDPIPTEDYYALYGILNSARPVTRTLDIKGPEPAAKDRLVSLKAQIRKALGSAWLRESHVLGRHLAAAIEWESDASNGLEVARGLDIARVSQFRQLLRRSDVDYEDPLYPVIQWMQKSESWKRLAEEYEKAAASRQEFNSKNFITFADFRSEAPAGWDADGWGYRTGHATNGDFAVATEGGDAVAGIFRTGVFTNLLSDRLNGVLRSPILPKDKKYLSLEVMGGKLGAFRLIMDGCVIGEDHQILSNPSLKWIRSTTKSDQPLPTYLELTTKRDNPRLPERPGKFKDLDDDQLESARSFWGVTRILLHDEEAAPKAELTHMDRFVKSDTPATSAELGALFQRVVQAGIRAWSEGKATSDDVVWLDWLLQNYLITNSRNLSAELRSLTDAYRKAEAALSDPAVVFSMADVDAGKDFPILMGGQAAAPGRLAPRHFLSLMPASLRRVNTEHSGRLELAEAIASKDNQLTARVMVNRLWHHVFGRGLVATTDNFGRYGEAPTHPELLDYLASRFMSEGWSMKKMIRLMVMSETFQQASQADSKTIDADPQNLLWSRYPVRRLEAEAVRDSILAVSGTLDATQFGSSIQPHRDEAKPYRRLFQGPLDGDGRRSIYLKVTRMEGPRFLEIFDFPQPQQTRGNRDVTNVPSQALALLNDAFVIEEAREWAKRLVAAEADKSVDGRLARMFESAVSRPATTDELTRFRTQVDVLARQHQVPEGEILSNTKVWKDVAHTFLNMKEFLYLR